MKKKLFGTLICVSIIASMLLTLGVSAMGTLENPTSSAGDPWGPSLKQYSDRNPYVTNWDTNLHTVWAARGRDGDCIRVKRSSTDGDNWVHVGGKYGSSAEVLTVGTEYTLSVDYLPGPYGYTWPSIGLQFFVGGKYVTFANMDDPKKTSDWKTFSADFTASQKYPPRLKLTTKSADIYLDNLVIKEKSTGNVVFSNNFDMLKIDFHRDWGYKPSPAIYAETNAVPFYGLPQNDCVGVIERDGGYAAYIRNLTGAEVTWRFGNMEQKVRALPDGDYKVKYDYVYCDTSLNNVNYLADRMSWSEGVNAATYSWATYETTFTKKSTTQCGFKIKDGCRMCVDNLEVTDLEGNTIVKEDFDTVPLWAGSDRFIVEPATLSQAENNITASAKVTNSYNETKSVFLITAIYNSDGTLEDLDYINPEIVGDPRGINHTTSIKNTINVSGKSGKTFKAFLWDLNGIKSLAASTTKTIE